MYDARIVGVRQHISYQRARCGNELVHGASALPSRPTYLSRPETDRAQGFAMTKLANGLSSAGQHADALTVQEAELSMRRRIGASEYGILVAQGNLATTYGQLGNLEKSLSIQRDVYSGRLKLQGEEHQETLLAANNLSTSLIGLRRFEETKSLLRKTMPVARRVLGEGYDTTLRMRWCYAMALFFDDGATLADLREAVSTLEDLERTARRVFGGAHPTTADIERAVRKARAKFSAQEGDVSSVCDAVEAMTTGDA